MPNARPEADGGDHPTAAAVELDALQHIVDERLSRGDWEGTLAVCERGLFLRPKDPTLHNARARALDSLGRHEEALHEIDEALAVQPHNTADLKNRAVLLRRLGRPAQALESFDAVLAVRAGDPDILVRRAHLLLELERREEALESTEQLLARQPHNLEALNVRGVVLERLGRYREALESFERMLSMQADHTDALNNRGMVLARYGEFAGALAAYDRSLAVNPEQPQAFYNRSLVRLALGDWGRGLQEFEGRWNAPPLKAVRLKTAAPLWLGEESLRGRTLFLHHEQGYGDTLQAVRYVPKLAALGAKIVLAVPPGLTELMRSLAGAATIIAFDLPPPQHDFHCPLMSLPLAFRVTPDTIEAEEAYLRADPERVRIWSDRLGPKRRPRIGLVWSGRQYPPVNYPRDMHLSGLQPLLALDADFISLQKDTSARDRETAGRIPNLNCRLIAEAGDFADTAALIETREPSVSPCGFSIALPRAGAGCSEDRDRRGIRACGSSGSK
jgi:tetratricopeptide (TPR) repeat protein